MKLASLSLALAALFGGCASTRPMAPAPTDRIAFVPPLTNPSANLNLDWGPDSPVLSCCSLRAADEAADAAAMATFPDGSLSAYEITPEGSLRGRAVSAWIRLHDGRTRACLGESEVRIGPEALRVLIVAHFGTGSPERTLRSVSVYRIGPEGLVRVFDAPVPPPNEVSARILPRGLEEESDSWRLLWFNPKSRVLRCWSSPDDLFSHHAREDFECMDVTGEVLGDEHPAYIDLPLEKWPCPVWVLTLDPREP